MNTANSTENSQLFISTHSPTLTSKVPFKNLILLDKKKAIRLNNQFENREGEEIIENTNLGKSISNADFKIRMKQLQRYIDVTKSQLLFAKSILFIEGISEELLVSAFTHLEDYSLEDYRTEIVNVKGTSFYPFLYLFNSSNPADRINKPISVLTDDDRFIDSKKSDYSFDKLIKDNNLLDSLDCYIRNGKPSLRIENLNSVKNKVENIQIFSAYKTLEFELAKHNISKNRNNFKDNFLVKFLDSIQNEKISKINEYLSNLLNDELTEEEISKTAILLWKSFPYKTEFAQDFSIHLLENIEEAKLSFNVPSYISRALNHLKK